jgi:hypothetical protein
MVVEVRCRRSDGDETDVDVHPVAGANDVAQQPAVPVDAVGRGLRLQAHPRAGGSSVFVRLEAALP